MEYLCICPCCGEQLKISVDSRCCAGTTKQAHDAALTVMQSCQIEVL